MLSGRASCSLLVAALLVALVDGIQFDVPVGTKKCLEDVLNRHDVAKGAFKVQGLDGTTDPSGVHIMVVNPAGQKEFDKADAVEGKFAFNANEAGSHTVCVSNYGKTQHRIMLDFIAGADAIDYSDVAKKEHLKPLELELRKLEDRVELIHKELTYQRDREEAHRNTNESTNARVLWFSVGSIIIVTLNAGGQVWYLYSFFKRKKYL